ncbi:hypothetical protein B6264_02495 [Kitasatospora aureofaciens]|nr:hypothetical protein B6264_02495 [Kitasatospora aureofaciens]
MLSSSSLRDRMRACDSPSERALELIANAWGHGRTPAPVVYFSLTRTLRVCVADESDALPAPRTPSRLAESGRGLQLVEGLTHRWGVDPQKRGKTVWYELDFPA